MIKLLIFDIDGVIVQSKKLHEIAFILALKFYGINITEQYHKDNLDGLPTKNKLDKLNVKEYLKEDIFNMKQKITFEKAIDFLKFSDGLKNTLTILNRDRKIALASNAIRKFCQLVIDEAGISDCVDLLMANEDVTEPKPSPLIYKKIMEHFNVSTIETLIFEDSKFGLDAAYKSGAFVCPIQNPSYLTLDNINKILEVYS